MDINAITQLIGSVGFPIVCCGYMMIKMNTTLAENTKVMTSLYTLIHERLCPNESSDLIE